MDETHCSTDHVKVLGLLQAGPLRGVLPHGTAMFLFLWGFFTFVLWIQTFRMNVGLSVCPPRHCNAECNAERVVEAKLQ